MNKMYSEILSQVQSIEDNKLKLVLTDLIKKSEDRDIYHRLQDNAREQYSRNWSIRINGCIVSEDDMKFFGHPRACMNAVYSKVIKPVLEKSCPKPESAPEGVNYGPAVLESVPDCLNLLSTAHYIGPRKQSLKDKNVTLPPSIIVRFRSRYMRNLFLRTKREFMPKPTAAEMTSGIKYYTAYADLTKLNHMVVTKVKSDERVLSVWTNDGKIRFSLKSHPKVIHHIPDISCDIATIINSAVTEVEKRGEPEKNPKPASATATSNSAPTPPPSTASPAKLKHVQPANFVARSRRGNTTNRYTRRNTASQSGGAGPLFDSQSKLPNDKDIKMTKFSPDFLANTGQY